MNVIRKEVPSAPYNPPRLGSSPRGQLTFNTARSVQSNVIEKRNPVVETKQNYQPYQESRNNYKI